MILEWRKSGVIRKVKIKLWLMQMIQTLIYEWKDQGHTKRLEVGKLGNSYASNKIWICWKQWTCKSSIKCFRSFQTFLREYNNGNHNARNKSLYHWFNELKNPEFTTLKMVMLSCKCVAMQILIGTVQKLTTELYFKFTTLKPIFRSNKVRLWNYILSSN